LLRKRKRLKQDQILDIKPSTWSNYEQGTSTPVLKDFIKICQFFGVTETQILHNIHLIEDIEAGKISLENTPKSTPKYTPNQEVYLQFNEDQGLYMKKEDANIVLAHMKDTMKTKDALITALQAQIEMYKVQLDECKKALKAG
jgi:transcriptional regulator with XRE-family HTH domain